VEAHSQVEARLLAAIRARPDDDAPRLVYADWLGDRGDPRGELIAVQCARAGMERDDEARVPFEVRERELRRRHDPVWRAWLDQFPGIRRAEPRRGLIDRVVCTEDTFATRAEALFAAAPALTELYLTDGDGPPRQVPPQLARVRSIRPATPGYAGAILASPHAAGLAAIELDREAATLEVMAALTAVDRPALERVDLGGLDDRRLRALASWSGMARLRILRVGYGRVQGAVEELVGSSRVARLERLDLSSNPLGPEPAAAVVSSPHLAAVTWLGLDETVAGGACARLTLPRLKHLRYGRNLLTAADAVALATNPCLAGLEELSLVGLNLDRPTTVDAEGAAAIVGSPQLAALIRIDLGQNHFGADAARVTRSFRAGFRAVDLRYTRLDDAAVEALAANPALATVTHLDLSDTRIGPAGYRALAASPHLRPRVLELGSTHPDPPGLGKLVRSPLVSQVRVLGLSGCRLGADHLAALSRSRQLGHLLRLDLHGNHVGDGELAGVARARWLAGLAELNLRFTQVTEAGAATLATGGQVLVEPREPRSRPR